jgi:thymidylate synthase
MNKLDLDYQNLLRDILENGVEKKDRTGTGTLSVFGRQIRHKMSDGFPLLTTKKMAWKTMVTELLWFLRGDTNIKFLVDNGCHIWDGDAYKHYSDNWHKELPRIGPCTQEEFINKIKTDTEFAKKWGDLGPIYGTQWRYLEKYTKGDYITDEQGYVFYPERIDQIANLINDLKTNPDSRRLMVSAWNVGELDQMTLPPCHFSFQCYSHEKEGKRYLSLAWSQRSIDFGLGLPFNIASYGLLLEIIARSVDMIPYELIGNLGDCHIYSNHIDGVKEQLTREPYPLPTLKINSGNENWHLLEIDEIINSFDPDLTFKVENYQFHPTIKLPLSN